MRGALDPPNDNHGDRASARRENGETRQYRVNESAFWGLGLGSSDEGVANPVRQGDPGRVGRALELAIGWLINARAQGHRFALNSGQRRAASLGHAHSYTGSMPNRSSMGPPSPRVLRALKF